MKIFVSHSSSYDYENKIYYPIKNSDLIKTNTFILPHDGEVINTKETIKSVDLMLAEVSLPTTGQGIEIGWADFAQKPILCVYEKGSKISSALKFVTTNFIEYENAEDMIAKITKFIEKM